MSFLRKLFGREEPTDVPVNLNVEMRADHTTSDPAWPEPQLNPAISEKSRPRPIVD